MNSPIDNFISKYKMDDIYSYFDKIKDINALIVGDTIIDVYQYGRTLGKSGKSPIVAFENDKIESYQGGILAIQNHLKEFINVDIYTGKEAIYKKRYIDGTQKLFETYTYKDNHIKSTHKNISDYDMVLIADFGHGFINKELQYQLESEAKYIALNTQLNAGNMGLNTINKYTHRNYVSIDKTELRLATSNQFDSIETIIRDTFTHETVSITDSNNGVYLYRNKELIHFPALARNIVDTVGAGDAYLSITSPLVYIQSPLDIIGFVGNCAGAIACTYQGNKEYISKDKMFNFISRIYEKNGT
jgi:bifunctional ADP-heptose synthase (sugar kinase/adenylyltransferase)